MRRGRVFGAALTLGLLITAGAWIRREAGGVQNAVSWGFWAARFAGRDLYSSKPHVLHGGNRSLPQVTITFDDGPHPGTTERILDTLNSEDVPAAFFVVGDRSQKRPDLLRRMIDEGHEVGNHTMTHRRLDGLNPEQAREEIVRCSEVIRECTGRRSTLFRPPGMRSNPILSAMISDLGYTTISWTVGAKDFTGITPQGLRVEPSADQVAHYVLNRVRNGSIILLHDCPATAEALPRIIKGLKKKGFRFASVARTHRDLPKPVFIVSNPEDDGREHEDKQLHVGDPDAFAI